MVSLVVEASNSFLSVACLEENKVISERNIHCMNNLSVVILEQIDGCLKDANKSKKDIKKIICSEGPGSYTAIRVVAAVCKTLAYTLKVEIATISSLKIQALAEKDFKGLVVPIIDARRNFVFGAVYEFNPEFKEVLSEGYYSLEQLNEFLEKREEKIIYVGRDVVKLESNLLSNNNVSFNKEDVRAANIQYGLELIKVSDAYNMTPQYLRKTEAERELENDKNK